MTNATIAAATGASTAASNSCGPSAKPVPRRLSGATPRVAIVIPCYRQAEFLSAAVASACAQTYRALEIVIVDDGSPDDTAAVAERLAGGHPDRPIRMLRQSNQGLGASRNNGIAGSCAEYVLALDADDLLAPTFVEDCVRVLDERPDVSVAYGNLRLFGIVNEFFPVGQYDLAELARRNQFPCTALLRRRAWADAGGYDQQLTAYEDWDLWLGCGERGHLGVFVPHALFYYRKRTNSMLESARERDGQLKAQIVLNHPVLFSPQQAVWARGMLEGDRDAVELDRTLRQIPSIGETPVRARRSGGAIEGARRLATLAFAEEVVDRPQLLEAYSEEFGGDDQATLVICGSEEQLSRLARLVEALGLDGNDAADLLGVVVDESPSGLVALASQVDALITQRPLRLPVPLPRVDGARVHDLRRLAEA